MTTEDTPIPGPLNNVIRIDDERIKGHLDRVVADAGYNFRRLLAWLARLFACLLTLALHHKLNARPSPQPA